MFNEYFKGIYKDRYILFSFVNADLVTKYRRSILGVAWAIITPLGLAIIIGGVYSILFNMSFSYFVPLLFASINPWTFMSGVAEGGTLSFIAAEGYIKQTTVSASIFPLRTTLTGFVNLLYSVVTFFAIFLLLNPGAFGPKMLLVIPGLFVMFIFTLGIANLTSIINLYVRDFQPFQSLVLQGFFYITPIIYPIEMLNERGGELIYLLNPFYYILEIVRLPMMGDGLPSAFVYLVAISIALCTFIASVVVLMKHKDSIVYKL